MLNGLSKLEIFNMALGFTGTRLIASEKEPCPEAAACALYFDRARRAAIRDYPYPFCRKRIRLAPVPMPSEYADGWTCAYALPPDCLKIIRVGGNAEFELARTASGMALFTNEENALALCAVDVPDPSEWDELFAVALAYRLALFIATPLLKNNPGKIQELSSLYANLTPAMTGHAASEGRRKGNSGIEDWISARADYQ